MSPPLGGQPRSGRGSDANKKAKFENFAYPLSFQSQLHPATFLMCSQILRSRLFLYASQLVIGYLATPLSIAALATAGATLEINLGSTGFGIIYSFPKTKLSIL